MVLNTVRNGILEIFVRRSKVPNMKVRQRKKLLAVGQKKEKGIRRGGLS